MTFLPIVERELRAAARRRGTYWLRLVAALVGLVIGAWILLLPWWRQPSVVGPALFYALSITGFVYGLLAGLFATADSLSEEKREGTLGLLFLTDLKGYDIVLGKIVATSVNVVYGLLALFPIMAIPLLAGGVTGAEFWRVTLVAVNNLFFSLAVGMFCSALCRDERKALALTLTLVLSFAILLPVAGLIAHEWNNGHVFHPALFVPSPGYGCFFAFDETWRALRAYNWFYPSVLCVHAMSWALLLAACFIVPRTWQDRAATPAQMRRQSFVLRLNYGSTEARAARRARLLTINPFYWLAARERLKLMSFWIVCAVVGFGWAWGLTYYPREWKNGGMYLLTAILLHTLVKSWLGSEACRRFAADRQSGALELLLSTPLSVQEMVRGQALALRKQFFPPLVVLLLVDFLILMAERQDAEWVLACVAGMIMLAADLLALAWVGMWRGLNSQHVNRAAGATLARILVLPWLLFGLAMTLIGLLDHYGRLNLGRWWYGKGSILLWLGLGLAVNAFFGLSAWRRLHHEFRAVATERFEQKRFRGKRAKTASG